MSQSLTLFLDDGGVMNDNAPRAPQWQRLVGEYLAPRLRYPVLDGKHGDRKGGWAMRWFDPWQGRVNRLADRYERVFHREGREGAEPPTRRSLVKRAFGRFLLSMLFIVGLLAVLFFVSLLLQRG